MTTTRTCMISYHSHHSLSLEPSIEFCHSTPIVGEFYPSLSCTLAKGTRRICSESFEDAATCLLDWVAGSLGLIVLYIPWNKTKVSFQSGLEFDARTSLTPLLRTRERENKRPSPYPIQIRKKNRGSTRIRTGVVGFKVQSDYHYTIDPFDASGDRGFSLNAYVLASPVQVPRIGCGCPDLLISIGIDLI